MGCRVRGLGEGGPYVEVTAHAVARCLVMVLVWHHLRQPGIQSCERAAAAACSNKYEPRVLAVGNGDSLLAGDPLCLAGSAPPAPYSCRAACQTRARGLSKVLSPSHGVSLHPPCCREPAR
jgi:hypothetical protein